MTRSQDFVAELKPWDIAFKDAAALALKGLLACPECSIKCLIVNEKGTEDVYLQLRCGLCGTRTSSNQEAFYNTYESRRKELLKCLTFDFTAYDAYRPSKEDAPTTEDEVDAAVEKELSKPYTGGHVIYAQEQEEPKKSSWDPNQECEIARTMVENEFKKMYPEKESLPNTNGMIISVLQNLLEKRDANFKMLKEMKDGIEAVNLQMAALTALMQRYADANMSTDGTNNANGANGADGANASVPASLSLVPQEESGQLSKTAPSASLSVANEEPPATTATQPRETRAPSAPRKRRIEVTEIEVNRVWCGLSISGLTMKPIFLRGWRGTWKYDALRSFFEKAGIQPSWLKEASWIKEGTLQMMVYERQEEEVRTKINGRGGIYIDEEFDWHGTMSGKSKKGLADTLVGINRQLERLGDKHPQMRTILEVQQGQVKAFLSGLEQRKQQRAEIVSQLADSKDKEPAREMTTLQQSQRQQPRAQQQEQRSEILSQLSESDGEESESADEMAAPQQQQQQQMEASSQSSESGYDASSSADEMATLQQQQAEILSESDSRESADRATMSRWQLVKALSRSAEGATTVALPAIQRRGDDDATVVAPIQQYPWSYKRLKEEVYEALYKEALQGYLKECDDLREQLVEQNEHGTLSNQEVIDELNEAIAFAMARAKEAATEEIKTRIREENMLDDALQAINLHKDRLQRRARLAEKHDYALARELWREHKEVRDLEARHVQNNAKKVYVRLCKEIHDRSVG